MFILLYFLLMDTGCSIELFVNLEFFSRIFNNCLECPYIEIEIELKSKCSKF